MASSSKMTDAERRKLIDSLNKDTEEFIKEKIEKNKNYKYTDGFTEDNIDEILSTHPAFMKSHPTAEEIDNNPLLKGLQMIQYDPDDDPYDKAMAHKKDGNFHFKIKKYQLACDAYTEALRAKCSDVDLLTILYSNRSAANFYLKNYRSSLLDASQAVKLSPDRIKSIVRCAQCCEILKRYEDGINWCKLALNVEDNNETAKKIMANCVSQQKILNRDARKQALAKEKKKKHRKLLLDTIKSKNIKLEILSKNDSSNDDSDDDDIKFQESSYHNCVGIERIQLDENNRLIWPALFLYPEYETSDFVQAFHEDTSFYELLEHMFENTAEWDVNNHYSSDCLQVFYEGTNQILYEVPFVQTLGKILSHPSFLVKEATPSFFILSKKSQFTANFVSEWTKVLSR